ncbi:MAG: hypothetical protein IKD08_03135 [Alphaproteobacteria bacterium]|nr:hypothetical protein [Alphaproteobacteria bacterium]
MIKLPKTFFIKAISCAAIALWLMSAPVFAQTTGTQYTTETQTETVDDVVSGANEIITEGAQDIGQSAAVYSDALHGDCPASGSVLLAHVNNCWACTLFDTIFRSINTLATAVYNKIAHGCIEILTVFLGIWLIIQVGRYIGSLAEQNPVEFFEGIISILCKAMLAGAILVQPVSMVTDLLISPIIVGATEVSMAVTQGFTGTDKIRPNADQISDLDRNYQVERQQIEEKYRLQKNEVYARYACASPCGGLDILMNAKQKAECNECKANPPEGACTLSVHCQAAIHDLDRKKESEIQAMEQDQNDAIIGLLGVSMLPHYCVLMETEPSGTENAALNSQLYNALMCMVGNLYNTTAYGLAMSSSILCHAWTAEQSGILPVQFPSLKMLFTGVVIWLVCFLLTLLFVFKLIDACFRLGFLLVLLPMLIVAWVFPPTIEFAKKGFYLLLHVVMVFISMAIVLSLAIALVEIAFGGNSETISSSTLLKEASTLQDYFNTNQVYKMNEAIQFSTFNFIIAAICCVFAIKILSLIDQIATDFSNVSIGSDIGDRLGMVSANVAAVVTQASATMGVLESQKGNGRLANWRASRSMISSMGAAPKQRYKGGGSSSSGSGGAGGGSGSGSASSAGYNTYVADAKTSRYAGMNSASFNAVPQDIELAKKALNVDGSYSTRESLQAKIALRRNANANSIYNEGIGGVNSAEQAYRNAQILRNVYGADAVERMSAAEREALVYKGEVYGITGTTSEQRLAEMNALDGNSFYKMKNDVDLVAKVRQGTATTYEEQKVYERIANGSEDVKRVLTMSETQFANYQSAIKASEATRS